MIGIESRRKRAEMFRKQKEEENIIAQINNQVNKEIQNKNAFSCNNVNNDKIKRTRMQNAKGTSNLFIKP
tara:strand:- start:98 stop:307 length:210 start_codon:yes stop_codon:yes gene_type:complete